MVTELKEYYDLLYKIQSENPPSTAILAPSTEPIYQIDLNSRQITAPSFLGVSEDHRAEVIYFKVPRYFEGIDLASTVCVINFVNAGGERITYPIPFYDIDTLGSIPEHGLENSEMIIPWIIQEDVTRFPGKVSFSFNFFKMKEYYDVEKDAFEQSNMYEFIDGDYQLTKDETRNPEKTYYLKQINMVYSLNTVPASTNVLTTIHSDKLSLGLGEYDKEDAIMKSANYLIEAIKTAQDSFDIFWEVL